jgi:hypothetical protein
MLLLTMISTTDKEKAIAIAISLLKHKNPQTVQMLKDLLTFIPNPNHVKEVLAAAVIHLVHTCPKSALWLFFHPDVLAPEIQARDIIAAEITCKILSWGYSLEDFHFTADNCLEVTKAAQQSLLSTRPNPEDESIFALIRALLMLRAITPAVEPAEWLMTRNT